MRQIETVAALSRRSPSSLAWLARLYGQTGRRGEARALLDELLSLSARRYVSPLSIGFVYFAIGENDGGFEWLEKAYAERSNGMVYLAVDPYLEPWRGDPRYRDLMRRVGLIE